MLIWKQLWRDVCGWTGGQLLFDECTDLGGEEVPLCIVHLCVLLVASITSNFVVCCTDLGGGEVPLCMCVLLVAIASNCFASTAD